MMTEDTTALPVTAVAEIAPARVSTVAQQLAAIPEEDIWLAK